MKVELVTVLMLFGCISGLILIVVAGLSLLKSRIEGQQGGGVEIFFAAFGMLLIFMSLLAEARTRDLSWPAGPAEESGKTPWRGGQAVTVTVSAREHALEEANRTLAESRERMLVLERRLEERERQVHSVRERMEAREKELLALRRNQVERAASMREMSEALETLKAENRALKDTCRRLKKDAESFQVVDARPQQIDEETSEDQKDVRSRRRHFR